MNDSWFRDRVWRPLLEKADVRAATQPPPDPARPQDASP